MSKNPAQRLSEIVEELDKAYPEAHLELDFSTPFELLVATILAAQSTDARVNLVTKDLFKKYPNPKAYLEVDIEELQEDIRSTGFYRNKSKSIVNCCQMLINEFSGELPTTVEEMTRLPGVGRKTANIVLANAMGIPGIGVDTHTIRVPNRLGLVDSKKPDEIEAILCELLPREKWNRGNILIQWHGRYTCKAKNPDCHTCVVFDACPWQHKEYYLNRVKTVN